MAKLAPRRRSVARVVIAGLLAWVLAVLGLVTAASPHTGFADAGAAAGRIVLCAVDKDGDEQHPPGRHDPCPCCILCPSCPLGGLAGMPMIPPKGADFPLPRTAGISPRRLLASAAELPPGWTSSW